MMQPWYAAAIQIARIHCIKGLWLHRLVRPGSIYGEGRFFLALVLPGFLHAN